ncbi:hypothetical protein [Halorarius halobius]|uniref:hypothetical protein n=1 Tax=Halorarius halobius TaxID=2962671 RepID=UPI0020CE838B|nr:hypothetical protein [Halorarius halobius]
MQEFPATPAVDDAPEVIESGHLWLQEWVVGAPLRFRLGDAGLVFGDGARTFDPWEEPVGYRFAARAVRETFDREAFRAAVDAPGDYTFLGVATRFEGVAYDWDRLPAFLGVDVHAPDRGFRTPDVAEQAFERLGLAPVNAVSKELPARDFRPERYEMPASAYRNGPVAGLLVRNKNGGRALVVTPAVGADPPTVDPETLVEEAVTPERIDRVAATLGDGTTVDRVLDRLVERLVRERYAALPEPVDADAIRSAAAESVARRLST